MNRGGKYCICCITIPTLQKVFLLSLHLQSVCAVVNIMAKITFAQEFVMFAYFMFKTMLHCTIFSATCLAMLLRDKLPENCTV